MVVRNRRETGLNYSPSLKPSRDNGISIVLERRKLLHVNRFYALSLSLPLSLSFSLDKNDFY